MIDTTTSERETHSETFERFGTHFKSRFGSSGRYLQSRHALEIMIAAKTPLSLQDILKLLGWGEPEKERFVRDMAPLLTIREGFPEPADRSLFDWLTDVESSGPWFIDRSKGHKLLAGKGEKIIKRKFPPADSGMDPLDERLMAELPYHLMCLGKMDKLKTLVTKADFFIWLYNHEKYQLFTYIQILELSVNAIAEQLTEELRVQQTEHVKSGFHCAGGFHTVGLFLFDHRHFEESANQLRKALSVYEKISKDRIYAKACNDLAESLIRCGNTELAKRYYQTAIRVMWRIDREHPETAEYINNLGHYFYFKNDFNRAKKLYSRSLGIRKRILPPGHRDIAEGFYNVGFIYIHRPGKGKYIKQDYLTGIDHMKTAVDIHYQSNNLLNKDLALYNSAIADAIMEYEENAAAAIPYIENTLAIQAGLYGVSHPEFLREDKKLESLYTEARKNGKKPDRNPVQMKLLDQSFERRRTMIPPGHDERFMMVYFKAFLMLNRKKRKMATGLLALAGETTKNDDVGSSDLLSTLKNKISIFLMTGDYRSAGILIKAALDLYRKHSAISPMQTLDTIEDIINRFLSLQMDRRRMAIGEINAVIPVLEEILSNLESRELPEKLFRSAAIVHNEVAFHLYMPQQRWKKAEERYLKAVEYIRKSRDTTEIANMNLNLQTLYFISGIEAAKLPVISKCTRILQEACDDRYLKGDVILTVPEADDNIYKWMFINICYAMMLAGGTIDMRQRIQVARQIKMEDHRKLEGFEEKLLQGMRMKGHETLVEEMINEALEIIRKRSYPEPALRHIIIQLLLITKLSEQKPDEPEKVIRRFAGAIGMAWKDVKKLKRFVP